VELQVVGRLVGPPMAQRQVAVHSLVGLRAAGQAARQEQEEEERAEARQ